MKIVSRPTQDAPDTIGSGSINVLLSPEQLQLITALVYNTRLGTGTVYSAAAFQLIDLIEEEYGQDFCDEALEDVNLQVSVADDQGVILVKTRKQGAFDFTLEV